MKTPSTPEPANTAPTRAPDFIRQAIEEDLASGRFGDRIATRFPPEPNGYLHIGHAKALCIDFGMAKRYGGTCNLRFDDTNPVKEDVEYVDAIMEDIRWLGYDWGDRLYYASDYFEQLYGFAVQLIEKGKAYVCDLSPNEVRATRGTLTEPGTPSPFRTRSIAENLDLFQRMRAGEFPEGARTLRAKIDMASPNFLMRDPVMYRILDTPHHRTGRAWRIYPMYDFAHGQCDSLERITHSLCSLEYEIHRELYEWFIRELGIFPSRQIEFARLNMTHTVLSKRYLRQLVEQGVVSGWNDPRMPTLCGMRRRGYTPAAIRDFLERIGVAKTDSTVDVNLLEHCLRQDLNAHAPRVMGVLRPLKVIIDNYPEGAVEELEAINNPEDPAAGTRGVPFARELYIEQDDFRETPPPKYYRLFPGNEVRLRYAYYITCTHVEKDTQGNVIAVHCTYDPATRGGQSPDNRKVKSTIHWVAAAHALDAEVRLYDRLFTQENPTAAMDGGDVVGCVNPASLDVVSGCKVEPSLGQARPGACFQFERLGYFCVDSEDAQPGALVFNRAVTLKDTWAKIEKAGR